MIIVLHEISVLLNPLVACEAGEVSGQRLVLTNYIRKSLQERKNVVSYGCSILYDMSIYSL